MFPVLLDLRGRLTLVVGGGRVALRKADALLEAGARVRLVCLEGRPEGDVRDALEWCTEPYAPAHLDGVLLAFAAALQEVNARVVADARAQAVLVCSSSDPGAGDFVSPATVRRGGLVVAVGTGGAAPALARRLRERLEADQDDAYADWVALLGEMRPLVLAGQIEADERKAIFEELTDWRWLEALRRDGVEATRRAMLAWLAGRGVGGTR
jgi:precorrin-2 dehydrogenase/sirohydrochlorin ferrochelatase